MNKLKLLLIFIFLILCAENILAHVGLDYPVGGEDFQGGEQVNIQWHVVIPHGPANWDLFFSKDGGLTWDSIAEDLPQSQTNYNWIVPNIETDSGQVMVIQDNNTGTDYSDASGNFSITLITGIKEVSQSPDKFILYPAYPNPFNPTTTIHYELNEGSEISLKIYNLVGEKIRTLVDDSQSVGSKSIVWDGKNDHEQAVGSGVYICILQAGNEINVRKMTLLK